jgi:hypothetical protein
VATCSTPLVHKYHLDASTVRPGAESTAAGELKLAKEREASERDVASLR